MKVKSDGKYGLLSMVLYFLQTISFNHQLIRATPMNQPTFNLNEGHVTSVSGQEVVLPCSINHLGKFKVVWIDPRGLTLTFDNKRVIDDQRFSVVRPFIKDWNLKISRVLPSDAGVYRCTINTPDVLFQSIQLAVKVSPQILVNESSSESMEVTEGDDVTLTCVVRGSPTPTTHWYKRSYAGNVLSFHYERMESSGEKLRIRNISRHGENPFHVYECVAWNGVAPDARLRIKISVHYPPEVVVPVERLVRRRSQQAVLECVVHANPIEVYFMEHRASRVQPGGRRKIEESVGGRSDVLVLRLVIDFLVAADFGQYKCTAANRLGRSEASIFLSGEKLSEVENNSNDTSRGSSAILLILILLIILFRANLLLIT